MNDHSKPEPIDFEKAPGGIRIYFSDGTTKDVPDVPQSSRRGRKSRITHRVIESQKPQKELVPIQTGRSAPLLGARIWIYAWKLPFWRAARKAAELRTARAELLGGILLQ